MSSPIPDLSRNETCQKCGHEFPILLRELHDHNRTDFLCPKCGHRNFLELTKFEQLAKEALDRKVRRTRRGR